MTPRYLQGGKSKGIHSGVIYIELAFILPILVLLTLVSVEISRLMRYNQYVATVAFEAVSLVGRNCSYTMPRVVYTENPAGSGTYQASEFVYAKDYVNPNTDPMVVEIRNRIESKMIDCIYSYQTPFEQRLPPLDGNNRVRLSVFRLDALPLGDDGFHNLSRQETWDKESFLKSAEQVWYIVTNWPGRTNPLLSYDLGLVEPAGTAEQVVKFTYESAPDTKIPRPPLSFYSTREGNTDGTFWFAPEYLWYASAELTFQPLLEISKVFIPDNHIVRAIFRTL